MLRNLPHIAMVIAAKALAPILLAWLAWTWRRHVKAKQMQREQPGWAPVEPGYLTRLRTAGLAIENAAKAREEDLHSLLNELPDPEIWIEAVNADRARLKQQASEATGGREFTVRPWTTNRTRENVGAIVAVLSFAVLYVATILTADAYSTWIGSTLHRTQADDVFQIALIVALLPALAIGFALGYKVGAWHGINPCDYAWRLLREGKYASSIKWFHRAIRRRPKSFVARYGMAHALLGDGKVDDAYRVATELRDDCPGSPIVSELEGHLARAQGRTETAAADYERAAKEAARIGTTHYASMLRGMARYVRRDPLDSPMLWIGELSPDGVVFCRTEMVAYAVAASYPSGRDFPEPQPQLW